MSLRSANIPFPSMDDIDSDSLGNDGPAGREPSTPSIVEPLNNSTSTATNAESQFTTSSSKLTSSDKLSALPLANSPNPNVVRPRTTAFSMTAAKRGFRRSLDATTSLPSFSAAELDSPSLNHSVWGSSNLLAARLEGLHTRQSTPDNGSAGKETPKQRVSFESDRHSLPNTRQAFSRVRSSDPSSPPPPIRTSVYAEQQRDAESPTNNQHIHSRSPSHSRSRAASPLRILQQWSSGFHLGSRTALDSEEPFIPINPYRFKSGFPFCCIPSSQDEHDLEQGFGPGSASSAAYDCDDLIPITSIRSFFSDCRLFFIDTLPRELYLNFLLRLPAMYFSRVARIFEDAEVSRPDIQRMIDASCRARGHTASTHPTNGPFHANVAVHTTPAAHGARAFAATAPPPLVPGAASGVGLSTQVGVAPAASVMHTPLPFPDEWTPASVSPALIRFKHSWEAFIDSLLREWKTLNVVSALLASAILTIFQIPSAADDPVTRTCALLSLICALMSLSYGCMYIVRFGTMRSMFHASRWAEQARKTKTAIWWNVWVLLATPAVWMAWSMILFISAILSFVWRTGSVLDPEDRPLLGPRAVLGPRILITLVLAVGLLYLIMIVKTLKKYGSYQGSAKALLRVGVTARTTVDTNGSTHHREPSTAGRNATLSKTARHEEDIVHRGRERERSISTHVRRREETNGMDSRERNTMRESSERRSRHGGGGLKNLLGLGFGSRIVAGTHGEKEVAVEMDVKIPDAVEVMKVTIPR